MEKVGTPVHISQIALSWGQQINGAIEEQMKLRGDSRKIAELIDGQQWQDLFGYFCFAMVANPQLIDKAPNAKGTVLPK